jgi:hypothetical protein
MQGIFFYRNLLDHSTISSSLVESHLYMPYPDLPVELCLTSPTLPSTASLPFTLFYVFLLTWYIILSLLCLLCTHLTAPPPPLEFKSMG